MTVSGPDEFELGTGTPLEFGVGTALQVVRFKIRPAPVNSNDLPFNQADGVYRARDSRGGMTLSLDLEVEKVGSTEIATTLDALLTAWVPVPEGSDLRFTWWLPGQSGSRYVLGTPRSAIEVVWEEYTDNGGPATAMIDFFASDPVIKLTSGDTVVGF